MELEMKELNIEILADIHHPCCHPGQQQDASEAASVPSLMPSSAGPAPAADADEPMEATRASPAPRSAAEITADLPLCQRPQPGGQGEAPQACR